MTEQSDVGGGPEVEHTHDFRAGCEDYAQGCCRPDELYCVCGAVESAPPTSEE